jgi:hypothetical protein
MRTIERSVTVVFALLLLTGNAPPAEAATVINITNQGTSAYLINGNAAAPNAPIQLVRGQAYTFQVSASGHPFHITTAAGLPPKDFVDAANLLNNGIDSGTITFTPVTNTPSQLFYQCSVHTVMTGSITVVSPVPAVSPFALGLLVLAALGAGVFLLRKRVRGVSPGARN